MPPEVKGKVVGGRAGICSKGSAAEELDPAAGGVWVPPRGRWRRSPPIVYSVTGGTHEGPRRSRVHVRVELVGEHPMPIEAARVGGIERRQNAHARGAARTLVALVLCVACSGCVGSRLAELPRGTVAERMRIVVYDAEWCAPCRRMKSETWSDASVQEWIDRYASLSVQEVRDPSSFAAATGMGAIPAVVVYQGEAEVGRLVSYRTRDEVLAWLEGLRQGCSTAEQLFASVGSAESDERRAMVLYRLAGELARVGRSAEAAEEYHRLWRMRRDLDAGLSSRVPGEIAALVQAYPPAREGFVQLRNELYPDGAPSVTDAQGVRDWIELCWSVSDWEAISRLYRALLEACDSCRDGSDSCRRTLMRHETEFWEALDRTGDWSGLGRLAREVSTEASFARALLGPIVMSGDPAYRFPDAFVRDEHRLSRPRVVSLYASCLAQGRPGAAADIADLLLSVLDEPESRVELVRAALRVDRPLGIHARWLDEAAAAGADVAELRERYRAAAAGPVAGP